MRRKFDFHDWWLGTVSILFLTLTVPVLSGWMNMTPERKLVVGTIFLIGLAALWMLTHRPRNLTDMPTQRIDLYDLLMAGVGCFFAVEAFRSFFRWSKAGITSHQSAVIAALGFLAIFSFFCVGKRGGLKKLAAVCFPFAGMSFIVGMWKLIAGSASPTYFYVAVPKEEGYSSLAFSAAFLLLAMLSLAIQRRHDRG